MARASRPSGAPASCDAIFFGYLGGGIFIITPGASALDGWVMAVDLFIIGLLSLDCAMRFGQLLHGDTPCPTDFWNGFSGGCVGGLDHCNLCRITVCAPG